MPQGKKRSATASELPADLGSRAQPKHKTKGVSFERKEGTAPELPVIPEVAEPVEAGKNPSIPEPGADKPVVEIIKRPGVPEDKSALGGLPARTRMVWSAVEKGMVRVRAKAKQHLPRPRASWFGHITDLGAFARGQSPRWGSKMRHQVVSSQVLMVSLLPLLAFLTYRWFDSLGAESVARPAPRAPSPVLGWPATLAAWNVGSGRRSARRGSSQQVLSGGTPPLGGLAMRRPTRRAASFMVWDMCSPLLVPWWH